MTRKIGESIMIGDDIEIIVKRIRGERVNMAIEAPRDVLIMRGELLESGGGVVEEKPPKRFVSGSELLQHLKGRKNNHA